MFLKSCNGLAFFALILSLVRKIQCFSFHRSGYSSMLNPVSSGLYVTKNIPNSLRSSLMNSKLPGKQYVVFVKSCSRGINEKVLLVICILLPLYIGRICTN